MKYEFHLTYRVNRECILITRHLLKSLQHAVCRRNHDTVHNFLLACRVVRHANTTRTNSDLAVETMNLAVETMNLRLNMSETENDESIPLTGRSSLRSGGRSVTKCDTLTQTHAHTHTHTHTHTPLVRTHICTRTYACRMWKEFGEYQDVLPSIAGVPNACVCSRPGSSRSARVSLSEKAFRGRQEGGINLFPNPMFENSNASFAFTGEYYLCKLNREKKLSTCFCIHS